MKKLSVEQASEILKSLGVVAQVVVNSEEADKDIDVSSITEEAESHIANAITPALKQSLSEEIGNAKVKQFGDMERKAAAKVLGVQPSEIKGKSLDELFVMVQEKFSTTEKSNDNEYIQRIQKMQEDFDGQLSAKEQEIAAAHRKYIDRDINAKVAGLLEKIPRNGKLDVQTAAFRAYLASIGELGYDEEKGTLKLTKDGNILLNNRNREYDFDELAKTWAEDSGIVVTKTGHETPDKKVTFNPVNNNQDRDTVDMTDVAKSWFKE